jgi:hypothetical protein
MKSKWFIYLFSGALLTAVPLQATMIIWGVIGYMYLRSPDSMHAKFDLYGCLVEHSRFPSCIGTTRHWKRWKILVPRKPSWTCAINCVMRMRVIYFAHGPARVRAFVQGASVGWYYTVSERASQRVRLTSERPSSGPASHQTLLTPLVASHAYPMCNPDLSFETSKCNSCNIQRRQMKHLKYAFETLAKTPEKHLKTTANIYATFWWNACNRRMKHMKPHEKYACNMHVYATSGLLLQHLDEHTCNICLIQMKHLELKLETYVYSHCNICNIRIYFCNTDTKRLQHTSKTSETPETYVCNMRFQCNISILLGNGGLLATWEWRLVGVWSSPV